MFMMRNTKADPMTVKDRQQSKQGHRMITWTNTEGGTELDG